MTLPHGGHFCPGVTTQRDKMGFLSIADLPIETRTGLEASEDIGIIWLVALPVPLHQGYHASLPHAREPGWDSVQHG